MGCLGGLRQRSKVPVRTERTVGEETRDGDGSLGPSRTTFDQVKRALSGDSSLGYMLLCMLDVVSMLVSRQGSGWAWRVGNQSPTLTLFFMHVLRVTFIINKGAKIGAPLVAVGLVALASYHSATDSTASATWARSSIMLCVCARARASVYSNPCCHCN